jgi:hypothetical protein
MATRLNATDAAKPATFEAYAAGPPRKAIQSFRSGKVGDGRTGTDPRLALIFYSKPSEGR